LDWIGKSEAKTISLTMMPVDNLWMARNYARESRKIEDPKIIVERVVDGVEEWLNIRSLSPPKTRTMERWMVQSQCEWSL
jgi:hypothetical protein